MLGNSIPFPPQFSNFWKEKRKKEKEKFVL
jgi:hypothetical protein